MNPKTILQIKLIALFIGIALVVANVFFILEIGNIKKQLDQNTANIAGVVNFINQSIQNAKDN